MRFLIACFIACAVATSAMATTVNFDQTYANDSGAIRFQFSGTDDDGDGWVRHSFGSGETVTEARAEATVNDGGIDCDYSSIDVVCMFYDITSRFGLRDAWFIAVRTDLSAFSMHFGRGSEFVSVSQTRADAAVRYSSRYDLTRDLSVMAPVPVPASGLLLFAALGGLMFWRRRAV